MEDEGFIDSFLSLFFFLEFGQFQVGLLDVPEKGIFWELQWRRVEFMVHKGLFVGLMQRFDYHLLAGLYYGYDSLLGVDLLLRLDCWGLDIWWDFHCLCGNNRLLWSLKVLDFFSNNCLLFCWLLFSLYFMLQLDYLDYGNRLLLSFRNLELLRLFLNLGKDDVLTLFSLFLIVFLLG